MNKVAILITLLTIPIMIFWYFYAYESITVEGYVNTGVQSFIVIGASLSLFIIIVYLNLLALIFKSTKASNDLDTLIAYEYLKVHVLLTLTALPLVIIYLFLFTPGASTTDTFDFFGLKVYLFPIITAYANVVAFGSMIYIFLFIRCFLYHMCNFDTTTRAIIAFYILYIPVLINPYNFYALKPVGLASMRPIVIITNFVLMLFMAVYAIRRLIILVRYVKEEEILIKLKLFVMSFLFFMFSFLPQVLWLFRIGGVSIFVWNVLTLNLLAFAAFLLYLGLK